MIRVNYPVGPLTHLRLRLELATRRTRRALENRRRTLRAEAEARQAARDAYLRLRWRQDLARERTAYTIFYDQYDALVRLLCLAAQEGIQPAAEEKYAKLRAWFCAHYPQVKSTLSPHLAAEESDAVPGRFGRRACDAFEALFFPPSIAVMLAEDGGNVIGRLIRTQAALQAWEADICRNEKACGD